MKLTLENLNISGFFFFQSTPTDYNQTFSLHAVNGVITLYKPLDYETQSFYHFNVSAKVSLTN